MYWNDPWYVNDNDTGRVVLCQPGPEPDDTSPIIIGVMETAEIAREIVDLHNKNLKRSEETRAEEEKPRTIELSLVQRVLQGTMPWVVTVQFRKEDGELVFQWDPNCTIFAWGDTLDLEFTPAKHLSIDILT